MLYFISTYEYAKIVLSPFVIIHSTFLENEQIHVNPNNDDIESPPDFMFTLFIQQNAEVKSTSSPRSPRRPSLAIIMQQNEVTNISNIDLYFLRK